MSLLELTLQLQKTFDECLESILSDPEHKEEVNEGLDTQVTTLKSSFLEIESQLKEIRLNALKDKKLSVQESNKLLKKDIDIKKATIDKYVTKLEEWEKEIPLLKENSKAALALRTDGTDFDSDIPYDPEATNIIASSTAEATAEATIEAATTAEVSNRAENINNDDDDDDDDVEFEEV